jgi:hypothetical protein
MGSKNTKYQKIERTFPTKNMRRIYELVSDELTFITKKMRKFVYYKQSEELVNYHIELIFLQLKTVYVVDQPSYQDFLTPPSYEEDEDKEKIRERKKRIFEEYVKECISYMNRFCSEYDSMFPESNKISY